jgi:hypothetical protein
MGGARSRAYSAFVPPGDGERERGSKHKAGRGDAEANKNRQSKTPDVDGHSLLSPQLNLSPCPSAAGGGRWSRAHGSGSGRRERSGKPGSSRALFFSHSFVLFQALSDPCLPL